MKKETIRRIALCLAVLCASLCILTACGEDNFETYMNGQPAMRSSIDARLAILSSEAKGSVQYKGDVAEVTVAYYALTKKEIEGAETEKITQHCEIIMEEAVDQYYQDTGKMAKVEVTIYGINEEKQ